MKEIIPDVAASDYGITTRHSEMDNEEKRFRLLKGDGTAYIRTEASNKGGWQKSHFHEHVKETYIVQRGWIGYAECLPVGTKFMVYKEGELFTTTPGIIHNIYMPANAIIHTVKHGVATGEDRITNERTLAFDNQTNTIQETELKALSSKNDNKEIYTAEYRHFDSLIWQLPMWCTAIFSLAIIGSNSITDNNVLVQSTVLTKSVLSSAFFAILSLFILILSHALYRFRKHQAPLKIYPKTKWWKSASTLLQAVVTIEGGILLFIATLPHIKETWSLPLFIVLITAVSLYREVQLRSETKNKSV